MRSQSTVVHKTNDICTMWTRVRATVDVGICVGVISPNYSPYFCLWEMNQRPSVSSVVLLRKFYFHAIFNTWDNIDVCSLPHRVFS